jgi:hypothetical protein
MRKKRLGLRRVAGLATFVAAVTVALFVVPSAFAVSGAVNTTDDPNWNGPADSGVLLGAPTQTCLNGQPGHTDPATNCNIYLAKTDVFLSGSPIAAALGDGLYFFAVLSPGGQPTPNDGGTNVANGELANLSDNEDGWTNREFTVTNGVIAPADSSTHAYDTTRELIQLAPYADTPNPGGVYILAVCKVPDNLTGAPGVDPRDVHRRRACGDYARLESGDVGREQRHHVPVLVYVQLERPGGDVRDQRRHDQLGSSDTGQRRGSRYRLDTRDGRDRLEHADHDQ